MIININNAKHVQKYISKELMPVAWHPTRWWDWCIPEDQKKEVKPFLDEGKEYKVAVIVSTKVNSLVKYQIVNGAVA